jgi:hypothetical protein
MGCEGVDPGEKKKNGPGKGMWAAGERKRADRKKRGREGDGFVFFKTFSNFKHFKHFSNSFQNFQTILNTFKTSHKHT